MTWLEDPVALVAAWPAFALPLFVFASAAIEYIFPPYWGDMFVLLGFFLSGQGAAPLWLTFAAALLGSILGSAIAYQLGQRYGLRIIRRIAFWRPSGTRERVRHLLLHFGERFLMLNRFVPVIRGLLLYGAGALKMRFGPSIGWSALSNLAWITLLMTVGLLTAGSWEEIQAQFRHTNQVLGGAAIVLLAFWVVFALWRVRRHRRQSPA